MSRACDDVVLAMYSHQRGSGVCGSRRTVEWVGVELAGGSRRQWGLKGMKSM